MKHLLIIDDDVELCELLEEYISSEGFKVTKVHDGIEGQELASENTFDLIILDVMLPGMSGFDILRSVRETSTVPVIMLTAKGEEIDKIVGLELGADDYLSKPFNVRELMARIRAILRRSEMPKSIEKNKLKKLTVGDVCLDFNTQTATKNDKKINLTGIEYQLLEMLLLKAGTVVERETLSKQVLGRELNYDDRSIDVHIASIRRKLGKMVGNTERIRTVRGVGHLYVVTENNKSE